MSEHRGLASGAFELGRSSAGAECAVTRPAGWESMNPGGVPSLPLTPLPPSVSPVVHHLAGKTGREERGISERAAVLAGRGEDLQTSAA